MSTLIQQILLNDEPVTQEIRLNRDLSGAHIRPWVYLHGTIADGELKLEVLQGATVLAERTITAAQLNAAKTDTYAHGFVRFDFDSLELKIAEGNAQEVYNVRLSMTNHTNDENNFVAWNRDWEKSRNTVYGDVVDGVPVNDNVAPFGLEIYAWESN